MKLRKFVRAWSNKTTLTHGYVLETTHADGKITIEYVNSNKTLIRSKQNKYYEKLNANGTLELLNQYTFSVAKTDLIMARFKNPTTIRRVKSV